MTHPLYAPELRGMREQGDAQGLSAQFEELHPASSADAIPEEFTTEDV